MHAFARVIVVLSMFGSVVGCVGSESDTIGAEEELRGGCRVVCPRCRPNQPCPRIACYTECHGQNREQCGDTLCPAGQVCCNASCGICTEPDGGCIDLWCGPVEPAGCTSDADCRTFSNYCDGCSCNALSSTTLDPLCASTQVSCFADPCMNLEARCDVATGACTLTEAAPTL
jgi:hypothetical protein